MVGKERRFVQSQEYAAALRTSLAALRNLVAEQATISIVPETLFKKIEDMDTVEEQMKRDLAFANDVVSQRCMMSAFVLQASQLEQSAEVIRDEFLEHDTAHLEDNANRLELFKAGVRDVRQVLLPQVSLLVCSDKDVSVQVSVKDETVNAVIRDAMDVRTKRLEELCTSLESLLASKERVSRQQVTFNAYRGQAHQCRRMDTSHQNVLREHAQIMSEDIGDKDDEEAVENRLVRFRNAVSTAESIQSGRNANDNVFTLLVEVFRNVKLRWTWRRDQLFW